MSLWRRQETKGRKKGGGKRKDKKREKRRRGKRLDYYYWCYYYFAISYKYSFLLLDESGRLALQAVSRVKSANERLLQGSEKGASPRRFPSSRVPFLSYEAIPRGNRAARLELREFV